MLKIIRKKPATLLLLMGLVVLGAGLHWSQRLATAAPAAAATSWRELVAISTTSDSPDGAYAPVTHVAPNGKTVIVMYNGAAPGSGGSTITPYYRKSEDAGDSWSAPKPVYQGNESASHVDFAFDSNGEAHAVWRTDSGLWYAPESDWPAPGILVRSATVNGVKRRIASPAIAVDTDNTIFVVWLQAVSADNAAEDVFWRYSRDGGATWTPASLGDNNALTTVGDASKSSAPDVDFDTAGDVHIVWGENFVVSRPPPRDEIFYLKGERTGTDIYQFGTGIPTTLSHSDLNNDGKDDTDAAVRPTLVVEGERLYVVFEERQENRASLPHFVQFAPGAGWTVPEAVVDVPVFVNTSLPFYLGTTLDVCRGTAHIYYHGALTENAPERVWGTQNKGGIWAKPQTVTGEEVRHIQPSVACSANVVYLSVEQIAETGGDHQIYYTDRAGGIFLPILFK